MKLNLKLLLFFIFVLLFYELYCKNSLKEHVSMGTLTQLMAKGPQDIHLSQDAEKWVNMQFPYPFVWNNPTRLYRHYPYYPYFFSGLYPYTYYPRNFVKLG